MKGRNEARKLCLRETDRVSACLLLFVDVGRDEYRILSELTSNFRQYKIQAHQQTSSHDE